MLLAVLRGEANGISAEAKYVLVRLAEVGLVSGGVGAGVKELAARFGISDSHVGTALNSLAAAGVLVRRDVVSGQGRPKRLYEMDASYAEQIVRHDVTGVIHEKAIRHLLKHELKMADQPSAIAIPQEEQRAAVPLARVRASRGSGRVSVVNRVLLAVLLSRADRFGVVRDLGSAELSRITGLSQVRLKNRVSTLLDSGLIRAYTPGATGSVIFKKTKSVYYLNLHHLELSCEQSLPMLLVSFTRVTTWDDEWDVVDDILHSAAEASSQRNAGVRQFFDNEHERRLASLLRSRLDFYAESLLSHHWGAYSNGKSLISQLIRLDLRSGDADTEAIRSLTLYLLKKTELVARRFRNDWFQSGSALVTGIDFESSDYVLLPARRVVGSAKRVVYPSRAVLALPRDGAMNSHRLYLAEFGHEFGKAKVKELNDLKEVSREDQAFYGLLTPLEGE